MKNTHKFYKTLSVFGLMTLLLTSCDLNVLQDPKAFTQDIAQDVNGAYLSIITAIKSGFDAHQKMAWSAGMIGNEELETILESSITLYPLQLEKEGIISKGNSQNRSIVTSAYQALAMADNAKQAIAQNTLGAKAKALYLANIALAEGVIYGDMSKFYANVIEFGSGNSLTPEAAKTKAIASLQESINQFKAVAAATDTPTEKTAGFYTDPVNTTKFLNSYIAMLHFDTGTKAQAAPFLDAGYDVIDAGKEIGIININALNGEGLYPEWRSGVEFQLNGYSQKFLDNRIATDTLRRLPTRWFVRGKGITLANNRVAMNYFYPQSPLTATTPAGGATLASFPLISWQEVALMKADAAINKAKPSDVIEAVLTSWRIPAARAKTLSLDPTITLQRVAQYEYVGRGRRWSAVGTYGKWEVANEFNFK